MSRELFGWPMDKNVEEFSSLSIELMNGRPNYYEKTAASAIMYLIARCKKAEKDLEESYDISGEVLLNSTLRY